MGLSRTQITVLVAVLLIATAGFAAAWMHERQQADTLTLSVGDQKLKIKTQ